MKQSDILRKLILRKYDSIESFENATQVNVSSILEKDLSKVSFKNIIKICESLEIDINDFILSDFEKYI